MLDPPLENPAREDQRNDLPLLVDKTCEDFAMTSGSIVELNAVQLTTTPENLRHVVVGQPPAVEIELVRLVDKLNSACAVTRAPIDDRQLHPQPSQEFRKIRAPA